MVGRGGGKNVCNRKQDGKGSNLYSNVVGEHVGSSNLVQNGGNYNVPRRSMSSSNQIQSMGNCDLPNQNALGSLIHLEHCQTHDDNMISNENQIQNESEGCISPHVPAGTSSKRKRTTNLVGRMNMTLEATNALDPPIRRDEENRGVGENANRGQVGNNGSIHSVVNGETARDGEATSKVKQRGERGKYKSYVVDMKIKGKKSKLQVYIPDDIDRAIGENARHFVNECGRVVRTRAPLNVKSWKEAFGLTGDVMWKEIEEKFQVKEGSSYIKMQAFAIETMQHLYRLWKSRLHYYYKNGGCGQNDEERLKNPPQDLPQNQWKHCVERFSSEPFKAMSERNSRNRLSVKRTKHTTGNNSFAEAEHVLSCENNGVKPSADVIWLFEHTTKNKEGKLQWADDSRSKEIYDQLKVAVATHGESMTQEEILLDVLKPRSGYFRGKGTSLRGYSKGTRQHLKQQKKNQEQDERIKELEETQEQTKKQLQETVEATSRQLEQQKLDMQRAMDAMKEELLREFLNKGC